MVRSLLQKFEDSAVGGMWPFRLIRNSGIRQFIKFALVGVMNTILDFSIYILLTRGFPFFGRHILTANAISFSVAVTNSYVLNTFWTFRGGDREHVIRFPKFLFTNLTALGLNELILYFLVSYAGLHDILSKALAICISLFWNFFVNKYWVFRRALVPQPPTDG